MTAEVVVDEAKEHAPPVTSRPTRKAVTSPSSQWGVERGAEMEPRMARIDTNKGRGESDKCETFDGFGLMD